jgi:hypothetical protein
LVILFVFCVEFCISGLMCVHRCVESWVAGFLNGGSEAGGLRVVSEGATERVELGISRRWRGGLFDKVHVDSATAKTMAATMATATALGP